VFEIKSISNCLCGCHYQCVGYCEKCKSFHKYEWDSKEIAQDNKQQHDFKRFRKPRRRM